VQPASIATNVQEKVFTILKGCMLEYVPTEISVLQEIDEFCRQQLESMASTSPVFKVFFITTKSNVNCQLAM
jgi:hypothetical protein